MELKDIVGIHVMNGIEIGTIKSKGYYWDDLEDCNYVKFSLDNTTVEVRLSLARSVATGTIFR